MTSYLRIAAASTYVAFGAVALWVGTGFETASAQTVPIPLCEIQRSLTIGARGEDVRCLQRYLNWAGYTVSSIGVGSPGNETDYFGSRTANAVTRWQNANAAQVLAPAALTNGTGYWGSLSFAHYVRIVRTALGV